MYGYIYITTNLLNGKKYIGQHRSKVFTETYKGSGKILWNAIEKDGWENFKVELLEKCNSKEELNEKEIYWIAHFNAQESRKFYNICKGGEAGPGGPRMKGKHHSEETKKRMSESRKGSLNSNYGNHWKLPIEKLERHRELRRGERNGMYGKEHTKETKDKISQRHKGNIWITNGICDKHIKPELYEIFLEKGFVRGRTFGGRCSSTTTESVSKEKDLRE